MTETDAKKKFCPHMRRAGGSGAYNFNPRGTTEMTLCIASSCMMWKWDLDYGDPDLLAVGKQCIPKESTTEGHCGLAK